MQHKVGMGYGLVETLWKSGQCTSLQELRTLSYGVCSLFQWSSSWLYTCTVLGHGWRYGHGPAPRLAFLFLLFRDECLKDWVVMGCDATFWQTSGFIHVLAIAFLWGNGHQWFTNKERSVRLITQQVQPYYSKSQPPEHTVVEQQTNSTTIYVYMTTIKQVKHLAFGLSYLFSRLRSEPQPLNSKGAY